MSAYVTESADRSTYLLLIQYLTNYRYFKRLIFMTALQAYIYGFYFPHPKSFVIVDLFVKIDDYIYLVNAYYLRHVCICTIFQTS